MTAAILAAFIVLVAVLGCVFTFRAAARDGYGSRPARAWYDTRRPEP